MRRSIFYQVSHHCQNFSLRWHFRNLLDHKLRPEAYRIQTDALTVAEVSRSLIRTQELICCTLMVLWLLALPSPLASLLDFALFERKHPSRPQTSNKEALGHVNDPCRKRKWAKSSNATTWKPLNPLINFFLHMWRFLWPGNGQPRSIDPQEFSRNITRDRQANSKKFAYGLRRVSSLTIWGEWTMSKTWDASPWNMSSEKRCHCACLQHWKYLSQKTHRQKQSEVHHQDPIKEVTWCDHTPYQEFRAFWMITWRSIDSAGLVKEKYNIWTILDPNHAYLFLGWQVLSPTDYPNFVRWFHHIPPHQAQTSLYSL